jgi:hypothetical protein
LFGLFQYQSSPEGNRLRLFYIPLRGAKSLPAGDAHPAPAKTGQ